MQRVLDVENGAFTPLVFGTNGGLGEERAKFLFTLAKKDNESYSHTITWIRTQLSFDLVQSAIAYVRGSQTPFRSNTQEVDDFELKNIQGDLARVRYRSKEKRKQK